jgi:hypothetical protein
MGILVEVIQESGYQEAMLGISLNHGASTEQVKLRVANKLAHMQGGHNKFLESMMVWLDVTAPRYWWMQADTYRMSTKQSESTMHAILKRPLVQSDFCAPIPFLWLEYMNTLIDAKDFTQLTNLLPQGYMQRRIWVLSYKTLQNIIMQRKNHKLPEWKDFCNTVLLHIGNPGFLEVPRV